MTAAVLSADETEAYFGRPLYNKHIQPVWLEIENENPYPVWILPYGTDPDYFPPLEVAYMHHITFKAKANQAMDRHFFENDIGSTVPAGKNRSGFIFTNRQLGTKVFNVELIGEGHSLWTFTFFINVPGLPLDYEQVDWKSLYRKNEIIDLDPPRLREALEQLPCCAVNRNGRKHGDPINLVIIGRGRDLLQAFVRSGWDETMAVKGAGSKTSASQGQLQQYRPVQPQYLFNRMQDVAFSKVREGINSRNQVRLWLSPYRLDGIPVWVGQIQREIRIISETIETRIDPDVDEARIFLLQDLWYAEGILKRAYVKGIESVQISKPRKNHQGAIYYTDGLRLVLWLADKPISFTEVDFVEWERPPLR